MVEKTYVNWYNKNISEIILGVVLRNGQERLYRQGTCHTYWGRIDFIQRSKDVLYCGFDNIERKWLGCCTTVDLDTILLADIKKGWNLFMEATTKEFANRIEKARGNWEEMKNNILPDLPQETFTVKIDALCQKYGMSFSQVQKETGITKSLFYSIVNGTRKPQRPQIIKIGFALGLSLEELNDLLKLAQHKELYAKNREDAILIYGLQSQLKVEKIEELLIQDGAKFSLMD